MCFLCVYAGYLCMCSRKCAQLHVRPETDISCLPRYSPSCFWTRGLSVDLEVTEASRSESSSNPPSLPPQGWDYRLVMLPPPPTQLLNVCFGDLISGPYACVWALCILSRLPSPPCTFPQDRSRGQKHFALFRSAGYQTQGLVHAKQVFYY